MKKSHLLFVLLLPAILPVSGQYIPNDLGKAAEQSDLLFMRMPEAWAITRGHPDILIGIIDLPADVLHEDLYDQVARDYQPDTMASWHGTSTAGCAAAGTDNGRGLASTGFNCRLALYPYHRYWYKKALAMAKDGVKVISFSSASSYYDPVYQQYIDSIHALGTVFVAAAGNRPLYKYMYPASYDHVISVGSVGHLREYPEGGPASGAENIIDCKEKVIGDTTSVNCVNDRVDICAPAWEIHVLQPGNRYTKSWGTSLSAPKVAGVCGLIFSIDPCFSPDEVEEILKSTAVDISHIPENARYEGLYGAGRLDAGAAVAEAARRSSRDLQGRYTSESNIESVWNIGTRGEVIIEAGASMKLRARHAITLSEGFEVKTGVEFLAETDGEMGCLGE